MLSSDSISNWRAYHETDYSSGQYAHIFVARLSADLTSFRWSTRLGAGNWGIDSYSILITDDSVIIPWYAFENDGDGYITGNGYITFLDLDDGIRTSEHLRNGNISQTLEGDLILFGQRYDGAQVTEGVYQSENNGQTDGYFAVVTQELEVVWATFLGGSRRDGIQGVTTMSDGSFVVCMETESSDLPVLNAPWSRPNVQQGDRDLYVARLSRDGSELLWAGYLGGSDTESLADMEVDDQDHVLICGWTKSSDFPTTPGAPYPENNCTAWYDGFITRLNGLSGAMSSWSTYLFDETCVGPYDVSVSNGRFALVGLFNPSWGGSLVPTTPDAIDQESVGMENFIIITTIHEGALPAGTSEFEWDGRTSDGKPSPRGAYCLTLQALDQKATRTITIR